MSGERRVKVGPDNYCEIIPLIPDEAVHAAAEAVYGCGFDGSPQKEAWLADFRKALEAAAAFMHDDEGYFETFEDAPEFRKEHFREQAKAILEAAAPHIKAQRVTSEEELDALPAGTVVLSVETLHHEGGWPIAYQRWQDGDWHRGARSGSTHPDNFLPATVLHLGAPQ